MGEIAEMMLDGTLCEGCGVFLNAEAPGYPCYCSKQCRADRAPVAEPKQKAKPAPTKIKCPVCARKVTEVGLPDHIRALHTYAEVKAAHGVKS